MPEGPPAAPFFDDLRFLLNTSSSKSNATGGTWFSTSGGRGSRGCGGLLEASVSCRRVASLPGARAAPSRACRADDNSPTCTNLSARIALNSTSSCRLLRPLLLDCAACSSQMRLASNNHPQSPRVKASNRVTNFSLDITPPPGGRCNNNLGNIKRTFHPRLTRTSSTPAIISSRTIFIAFRKGPCKKRGTDLITEALNENSFHVHIVHVRMRASALGHCNVRWIIHHTDSVLLSH